MAESKWLAYRYQIVKIFYFLVSSFFADVLFPHFLTEYAFLNVFTNFLSTSNKLIRQGKDLVAYREIACWAPHPTLG